MLLSEGCPFCSINTLVFFFFMGLFMPSPEIAGSAYGHRD